MVQKLVPSKLGQFEKAYSGKSLRAAINANCLDCMGYALKEVKRCRISRPFHSVRPYQPKGGSVMLAKPSLNIGKGIHRDAKKSHWHSDLMRRVKEPEYVGGRHNEAKKLIPQLIWWGYSSEEVFQMLRSKYSRSYTDSQLWNTIRWAQRTVTPRSPDRFKPQARRVSYPRVRSLLNLKST